MVGVGRGLHPDARPPGQHEGPDRAGAGRERLGMLGVHPALDGMPGEKDVVLLEREGLSGRDPDLRLDDVDAGHRLGDAVLDLNAGIDLHEVEPAVAVHQELERARVHVADGPRRRRDEPADALANVRLEARRRGLLDDLLLPALHRALAFAEMHGAAPPVGEDLELDVPGAPEVALEIDAGVAEGRVGLAHGGAERLGQAVRGLDEPHAPAAAAADRLDEEGIADLRGRPRRRRRVLHGLGAGDEAQARRPHGLAGPGLVAEQPQDLGGRSDERDAGGGAPLGEVRALRQEAVAGVYGVGAGRLRRGEDGQAVEIAVPARGGPDAHRLVGEAGGEAVAVGLRMGDHGADAELPAGGDHPQGDLAPVGDEDLSEHVRTAAVPRTAGA